ncbi:MAG: sigma-54 dependent transcriptional regulator [Desulfobacteraceae bacterium]|nr:sigma-54 dependent transcriptional regulator [Desulfobacteraceae bacterium]
MLRFNSSVLLFLLSLAVRRSHGVGVEMGKALIISGDQKLIESVSSLLAPIGHTLFNASDLCRGWALAIEHRVDVVTLATELSDGDGLVLLPRLKQLPENPEVVVVSDAVDPRAADFALRNCAWDYLITQGDGRTLAMSMDQAMQYRQEQVTEEAPVAIKRERIVGNSPQMKSCFALLGQAAGSNANVLIVGETGTGKELFARAIHSNSPRARARSLSPEVRSGNPRADKNFVVVDCTALPETLVESVLFGHAKGAFTGADRDHDGLIAQADGGTLFLDEIGELPLNTQKAFLRVLQERHYRPVGGKTEHQSDFRLIAATNRDLDQMVDQGTFRKDLLFRLRGLTIALPPLRGRPDDIKDLVRYHTQRMCDSYDIAPKGFALELLDTMAAYSWPGNVRELVHTIDAMLAVAGNDATLYPKHLPAHIRLQVVCQAHEEPKVTVIGRQDSDALGDFKTYRNHSERRYLEDLLRISERNIPKACQISGISRSRLYEMLAKHALSA